MPTIDQVKAHLAAHGVVVLEFAADTPTADTAAAAVGCTPAEIAKSILFLVGGEPLLVVTCGDMKVSGGKLKRATGHSGKVRLPQADEVEALTGYAPGGVCPFLLPPALPVLLDVSLRRFPLVYAAAGNDHSAVPVAPARLLELICGVEVDVCEPLPCLLEVS